MTISKAKRLKTYSINVLIVPPNYEVVLGIAKVEHKTIKIEGTSLEDAKRRAGIE